ncbi:TPA: hypothetical protein ACQZHX_002470 [Enterobacter sichuanensis]
MSTITTERLTKILSETQAVITECNSRGVHGSVEVNSRLFENVLMELLRHRAAMFQGVDTELQRKAAIHDALCEKHSVESLADFVAWQRNHIAELEAAPPAPVGKGEAAVMPDYPGYTMTQRECYQAGKKAGLAEAGSSPVVPDGYALVPVEPTLEMIKAGANAASAGMLIPGMYRAMITAAPQQEVKQCT